MSIENAIVKLADSLATAAERLATALDKNSDAAILLAEARKPVASAPKADKAEKAPEPAKTDADQEKTEEKKPAEKAPAKKPAAKKAPAKKKSPEPEPEVVDENPAEEDAPKATFDDVRAVAVKIRDELGAEEFDKARKALNIKSIKDLPEENYSLFIRHCEDRLAAAGSDDGDL